MKPLEKGREGWRCSGGMPGQVPGPPPWEEAVQGAASPRSVYVCEWGTRWRSAVSWWCLGFVANLTQNVTASGRIVVLSLPPLSVGEQ